MALVKCFASLPWSRGFLHRWFPGEGSLTQLGKVRTNETVRFGNDIFHLHVWPELHVLRVDPQGLQTAVVVWNPDVQLAIEAAEAPKHRVDGVGFVGGSDDDRLPTTLHAIHERQGPPGFAAKEQRGGLIARRSNLSSVTNQAPKRLRRRSPQRSCPATSCKARPNKC